LFDTGPNRIMHTFPLPAPLPVLLSRYSRHWLPLHTVQNTRTLELQASQALPPHALMQRAGVAVARVALALAPHARTIWVACGPGNNGGDGLQAAAFLQQWGKTVQVTLLTDPDRLPADARHAYAQAMQAGVALVSQPPDLTPQDLCIDALLGIGASRAPDAGMLACIRSLQASQAPTLAVDLPTGLHADTGAWLAGATAQDCVQARHTVTLLTLKPGLFTGHGRDAAGTVWWDDLGVPADNQPADAWLQGACTEHDAYLPSQELPAHASHKGNFGDVCVIGGDTGMQGAALLAGEAALNSGAGRVYVGLLQTGTLSHDAGLMVRHLAEANALNALPYKEATTVCGCGAGQAIAQWLPDLLQYCPRLVMDADALNAVAANTQLQDMLRQRAANGAVTVLTPHPLEAARLLGCHSAEIQRDRIAAANALAKTYQCMVVLKGSGSICVLARTPSVMAQDHATDAVINFSGNARLATPGTGDVLAGCMGAYWAQAHAKAPGNTPGSAWGTAWRACCAAVHAHGWLADSWNESVMHGPLLAQRLAQGLRRPDPEIWKATGNRKMAQGS
jgi:hydroxyethylthiazole kinase-like uncharacterized protein yjeF